MDDRVGMTFASKAMAIGRTDFSINCETGVEERSFRTLAFHRGTWRLFGIPISRWEVTFGVAVKGPGSNDITLRFFTWKHLFVLCSGSFSTRVEIDALWTESAV
ncbi:hypothetical protein Agabi119p4_7761 [Agaricus bisporus var. burnettii]|uniref:Uncharacterized protein n=1 Tax=Agaricus bisporus var. burnettii TaxID=192524 RepID=A0A8H7C8C9_AGABI|nr:hypothetical protein Agabi119p4_7761 [Agaricus bisporus var. burnettii]